MFVLLTVTCALLTAVYWWYNHIYKIDTLLERFPGPKTIPILGNALQLGNRTTMIYNLQKLQKQYGGIYRLKIGPVQQNLVLTDHHAVEFLLKSNAGALTTKSDMYNNFSNWLGTGLVLSSGEHWKQHRKILSPAFHSSILGEFLQVFDSAAVTLLNKLDKLIGKDSIDVTALMSLCTLDIICESTMRTSINAQGNTNCEYAKSGQELCRIAMARTFSPIKMFDFLYRFSKDYQTEKKLLKIVHQYPMSVIKSRKEAIANQSLTDETGKKKRLTILDLLLEARIDGKPIPDKDIRDEVDTFMFTGLDTSAATLNFLLYCISKNLHIQEKLIVELKTIFGDDVDRPATLQELNDMNYLEMVIKEALRIYPPVSLISRKLEEDVEYDGGILPKGLTLIGFIFGIHRNPENYPDPEKFDPERFAPENCDGRNPYTYIPFSSGPRNCIGQRFAMLEIKIIISKLLRRFEVLPTSPEHNLILVNDAVLKSNNGVLIKLKKRKFGLDFTSNGLLTLV